ncbi:MAG: C1 family peptidase [bacterium]
MKKYFSIMTSFLIFLFVFSLKAQQVTNKGKFIEKKNPFWEEIVQSTGEYAKGKKPPVLSFQMDFAGMQLPKSPDEFTKYWHGAPVSQGNTNTCWSFSTTSFFESEVNQLSKKVVKISEMFTVYWEYVEKTKEFIRTRGISAFSEGSEANAVKRMFKIYGAVPLSVYSGKLSGQEFYDHSKLITEMNGFLQSIKEKNAWNEDAIVTTIKTIMNHYLGTPPEEFEYEGKTYTPKSFLKDYLQLNPDDYVDVLSYLQKPYWKQVEYEVPDNWWHDSSYYNIPLEDYIAAIKKAVRNGYSICIGGDVSEPGRDNDLEVFVIPTFDVPAEYIDENSRQMRFSSGSTTDDHGIHIVGYKEDKGKDWYLIKDSGSGSFCGPNKGYFFFHEDYVKLKMMDFMIHKDAVPELLAKFK